MRGEDDEQGTPAWGSGGPRPDDRSTVGEPPPGADELAADVELLGVYLNDHLAGSVAGLHRFERAAEALGRAPVGALLGQIAEEIRSEQDELREIIVVLGYHRSMVKQAAGWVAERLARVKNRGSLLRRSPASTLLEVELLRSAVMGKRGVWQTLAELAPQLGLEPGRMQGLLDITERQLATLDEVHAYVRARALRGVGPSPRRPPPAAPRPLPGAPEL